MTLRLRSARALQFVRAAACLGMATLACSKEDAAKSDYSSPISPAAPVPQQFATTDFNHLRWLEGKWRGRMPNGSLFYESYIVTNDSTMLMGGYSDSTFNTKSDSSVIGFREGKIINQGTGPLWHASSLDSASVDFQSPVDKASHFTWTHELPDRWTARIFGIGPDGKERVTLYVMERIR